MAFPVSLYFEIHHDHGDTDADAERRIVGLQLANTPEEFAELDAKTRAGHDDPSLTARDQRYNVDAIGRASRHASQNLKREMKLGMSSEELYPLDASTGSEKIMALGKAWLNDCLSNHEPCNASKMASHFRARLFNLSRASEKDGWVTLQQSLSIADHAYATLSLRWGSEKPLQLTQDTEATLTAGFEMSRLSPMFRDAVCITKRLGLQYLWIDSLFIMQDSRQDWLRQAANMGSIYKCATINVAATNAGSCSSGIFCDRNPAAVSQARIKLSWKREYFGIAREQTKECLVLSPSNWENSVEKSLLASRGWIFQERILSPRVLHFTADRLFWECYCSAASKSLPTGRPYLASDTTARNFRDYLRTHASYPNSDAPLSNSSKRLWKRKSRQQDTHENWQYVFIRQQALVDVYGGWLDVIKTYSACELTKPTDKLIALRGVAIEMWTALRGRDLYLDGHWFSSLPYELLWTAGKEIGYKRFELYHAHPPKEYSLAPTWSWASVIGSVEPFREHLTAMFLQQDFAGPVLIEMERV